MTPLGAVPLDAPLAAGPDQCPMVWRGAPRQTAMAWVGGDGGVPLSLVIACTGEQPGSCVFAWDVLRRPISASNAGSQPKAAPQKHEDMDDAQCWTWSLRTISCVSGRVLTSLISSVHGLPAAGMLYATVLSVPEGGDEAWCTLDDALVLHTCGTKLSHAFYGRTAFALSPVGALACTLQRPGTLACVPLPTDVSGNAAVGRHFALALLRNVHCADVAHAARLARPALSIAHIPGLVQATAAALHFGSAEEHPTLAQTLQLQHVVQALTSARTETPYRQLYARAQLFIDMANVHRTLCAGRMNPREVHEARLGSKTGVAFAPRMAWALASQLRQCVAWLTSAARAAVLWTMPATRADDLPADTLLELLVHPGASHLFAAVLSGLHAFATWVSHVAPDTWIAALDADDARATMLPRDTLSARQRCEAALSRLESIRTVVHETLRAAPMDISGAAQCLARSADGGVTAYWTTLLHVDGKHASTGAKQVAAALVEHVHSDPW